MWRGSKNAARVASEDGMGGGGGGAQGTPVCTTLGAHSGLGEDHAACPSPIPLPPIPY